MAMLFDVLMQKQARADVDAMTGHLVPGCISCHRLNALDLVVLVAVLAV